MRVVGLLVTLILRWGRLPCCISCVFIFFTFSPECLPKEKSTCFNDDFLRELIVSSHQVLDSAVGLDDIFDCHNQ